MKARAILTLGAFLAAPAVFAQTPTTEGVVGIITGMPGGTYAATAGDLMVLDDPSVPVRVIPMNGKGSLQNLTDVLHLRGVDVGFVQSDALLYAKQHQLFAAKDAANIQYIAKLYDEEVHVIARSEIKSMEDLAGKKVNVDVANSGSAMTAVIILSALGINATISNMRQVEGVQALKNGQIDAIIHVGGAPIPLLAAIPSSDLHFVPIGLSNGLDQTYLPAKLSHDEYPALIPDGAQPVDTIAVGDVMAVYGWPKGSVRYRNVARFVDALFQHIDDLQRPPHHPKWREVNLAATVPGWPRFPEAQAYIDRESRMNALGRVAAMNGINLNEQQKRVLFQQYQDWLRTQAH